jgi:hypothetical protein
MKTTKLYMVAQSSEIKRIKLQNVLLSYIYIPKNASGYDKFHRIILERRELRKQAKEERQNQGTK